jgi:hypothetical protein
MADPAGEAVVDRVVEDVVERPLVLLFGLDRLGPEPAAEDVVGPVVALVEGARVLAVQVAHAFGQVPQRRLDEQVVVVAEEAAGVQPPAIAPADALQDPDEDRPVPIVGEDRRAAVPFRPDVVVGAGGNVAESSSHGGDRTGACRGRSPKSVSRHARVTDS